MMQHVFSPTPVPAPLQTCREARNLGLYKQTFSELLCDVIAGAPERRYIWLNLEIDMISIGKTSFITFKPVAPQIQRLRFERSNSEESFYYFEATELRTFVNAKEIQVVCGDGLRAWHGAKDDHDWPCSQENLFFIDPKSGQMIRSIEMDDMFDRVLENQYRQEGEASQESWAVYGYDYPSGERGGRLSEGQ